MWMDYCVCVFVGGGGGAKGMLPLPRFKIIGGLPPCIPPSPSSYAYVFKSSSS